MNADSGDGAEVEEGYVVSHCLDIEGMGLMKDHQYHAIISKS